jgi:chromosome segregation ATPase
MMTPENDHLQMIGPWGWLGWVLFAGALMLYYRLWTSTSADELRRLKEELDKARKTIAELRELELKLKNRNDELNTAHARLHGEFLELRGQFQQLNIAFGKQGELVASLREEVQRERKLRDDQFAELMRTKGKHGEL